MKKCFNYKSLQIALIVIFAMITVSLTNIIVSFAYGMEDNLVETQAFRQMNIHEDSIRAVEELSQKSGADLYKILACHYIFEKCRIKQIDFSLKRFQQLNSNYEKMNPVEYSKVNKAMAAIFHDLVYFPVAKSHHAKHWVAFENSFGADRNYNGKYLHEGTDIMAIKNVSGYYPIVSVTDGVVENIGWLEKGGYRVGIRSNSGGYFYYAHLSSYGKIKKGDQIKAGTLLGYMGDTGYGKQEGTSGNFDVHLHFGIYIKTENYEELSVNPYHILKYLEEKLIVADY